jgi:Putative restriction endonuclease
METSETLDIWSRRSVRYHGLSARLLTGVEDMPTRVVLTYRDYEALPADGRRYEVHEGELLEGAPTLAVEIVSPSTDRLDRGAKLQLYARHGIPHYWTWIRKRGASRRSS